MATEAIVPSAPAAAPSSAPSGGGSASSTPASSAPAPVSAPASQPAAPAAPDYSTATREQYAARLLEERLAAIPSGDAGAAPQTVPAAVEPATSEPAVPAAAPDATAQPADVPVTEDEPFRLDDPVEPATPDVMSKLITERPEFGSLLEQDQELRNKLFMTARLAAEAKPFKQLFPDVRAAEQARDSHVTFSDVRTAFEGSTTREGTLIALGKIAELCYERDDKGQPIVRDGKPVLGQDFYGFVDHVVQIDMEGRLAEAKERLQAGRYANDDARDRDERFVMLAELVAQDQREAEKVEDSPEAQRARLQELERREAEARTRQHSEKVAERDSFESGIKQEAKQRITTAIERILKSVESQGGVLSPYLKHTLPLTIGAKLSAKLANDPMLSVAMRDLQLLPIGDDAKKRRLKAVDKAIQDNINDIARVELREAGVQIAKASANKDARVAEQTRATNQTEPKGSTAPVSGGRKMESHAAYDAAQAEWQRANPGKPFDKVARESILSRVLSLMTGAA